MPRPKQSSSRVSDRVEPSTKRSPCLPLPGWRLTAFALTVLLAGTACLSAQGSAELELIASGLDQPLGLTHAGDGSGRLFVTEQGGAIRIIDDGEVLAGAFLDISDRISTGGERGLLGLAFDPDYESNRHFFVNYTDRHGDTVVSRFTVSASDPNRADSDSELVLLEFEQPFSNHNGGHLAFGPDGYLYIGTGDGGSGGDPQNNAQDLGNLLGKILRLDVSGGEAGIPADNPFVSQADARAEIWAYGLRNPWRFSFDRKTGDLFIADVGQNAREEIDFQPASSTGGENYGWRLKEGSACFNPSTGCNQAGLVDPILEYGHGQGCSVTGGFRYRAKPSSGLNGVYIYGDYCSGTIWGGTENGDGSWSSRVLTETDLSITSFGEDESGRVYVIDRGGTVFRFIDTEILASGFETGDFTGWTKRGPLEITSPGLGGTAFALAVMAGTFARTFVRTKAPKRERAMSVSFLVNPKDLELRLEEDLLHLADGKGAHVTLTLEQLSARRFRVALYVMEEAGRRLIGKTKIRAKKTTRLAVEWARASAPDAADGVARLIKKLKVRAAADDVTTGPRVVNLVKAGLPLGSKGSAGRLVLDEFVLTR